MLVSGRVNGNKHICYCFSNHFIRLLLQATETPPLDKLRPVAAIQPLLLTGQLFVTCNNLRFPTVESAEAPEPLLRGGKINQLVGRQIAGRNGHTSLRGKKPGTAKSKGKVPCLEDVVPLTHGCCAATSIAGNNLYNCSLILMKGRPLNHQLADDHLPSILVLVSNARNLHNSRIPVGRMMML